MIPQVKTYQKEFVKFFWLHKHIVQAPFLRFWNFTIFVVTASTTNPWMFIHPSANRGPSCFSVLMNWCIQLGIAVAPQLHDPPCKKINQKKLFIIFAYSQRVHFYVIMIRVCTTLNSESCSCLNTVNKLKVRFGSEWLSRPGWGRVMWG